MFYPSRKIPNCAIESTIVPPSISTDSVDRPSTVNPSNSSCSSFPGLLRSVCQRFIRGTLCPPVNQDSLITTGHTDARCNARREPLLSVSTVAVSASPYPCPRHISSHRSTHSWGLKVQGAFHQENIFWRIGSSQANRPTRDWPEGETNTERTKLEEETCNTHTREMTK